MAPDWPLATAGRLAQKAWNWLTRRRHPVTGLYQRLLADRDAIRTVLGKHWRKALLLTTGRLAFDYACLLAALHAANSSRNLHWYCSRTPPREFSPSSRSPPAASASCKRA